jgi:hypothetical protein
MALILLSLLLLAVLCDPLLGQPSELVEKCSPSHGLFTGAGSGAGVRVDRVPAAAGVRAGDVLSFFFFFFFFFSLLLPFPYLVCFPVLEFGIVR